MRIAIGQISHESNAMFGPPTSITEFQRQSWGVGDEIIRDHTGVRGYLGGMIAAGADNDIEIIPTFGASAHPSGTIERSAFDTMLGNLLEGLKNVGEFDAVCLSLHGAGSADGVDDIEGTILEAVREQIGPDIPLISTLDLHCHATELMVENATALLTVHEYPHIDSYERGYEAVKLAAKTVRGEASPVMALTILPMIMPGTTTFHGPAKEINELCWEWEDRGLLDITFIHGYPHTDVPVMSTSVIAVADGDPDLAKQAANDIAGRIWAMREQFRSNLPEPADAIEQALAIDGGPVVIAEVSDNPGSGAPGDSTHLLRALLEAGVTDTAFGFVYDPETAIQAHEAGPGATIDVRIGGKTDPDMLGAPVEVSAYVKCCTDGRFIAQSPMGRGSQRDYGKMALLVVDGIDVIVGSESQQTLDDEVFRLHGIQVSRLKIAALKSHNHFRAGFEPIAAEIIRSDPPGWATSNLENLNYQRIRRPIWPLDEGVEWNG